MTESITAIQCSLLLVGLISRAQGDGHCLPCEVLHASNLFLRAHEQQSQQEEEVVRPDG